jgi:hypothetical protein
MKKKNPRKSALIRGKSVRSVLVAKVHAMITDELQKFIARQHMFFVSTAPLSADGHVNVSPKGLDCFRVLSPQGVAYMDMVGSGNETSAHLLENGRITFMFCAFDGPPNILRLYGRGRVVLPGQPEWDELAAKFTIYPTTRQLIVADIDRVQTSCGFNVPLYEHTGERDFHFKWAQEQGETGIATFVQEHSLRSIDDLLTPLGAEQKMN